MQQYTINHLSKELTEDEFYLILRAIHQPGKEATAYFVCQEWFNYKNDPTNTIKQEYADQIFRAIIANGPRIMKAIQEPKTTT